MDHIRRKKAFKILLAIALYMSAVFFSRAAHKQLQYTHIVLDSGIQGADVEQIQRQEWEGEEPIGFCFWGEKPQQMVTCRETGGVAMVTQILLAGNPGLMDAASLAWQEGCLVDKETAENLFGTASVGSQILWHSNRPYPVLGIVDSPRPTMVLMAGPEDTLDRLVLSLPPEKGDAVGSKCMLRWGIQGTILDFFLLWSLVNNLLLLFPVMLMVRLCAYLAKDWRTITVDGILYGGQWCLLGKLTLAVVIAVGILLLLFSKIIIPKDMIPSQWSDFSFWERWWESEKENAVQILFTPLGNGQLQMLTNMVKSVVANMAACLVLLWPTRRTFHADLAD